MGSFPHPVEEVKRNRYPAHINRRGIVENPIDKDRSP
jgi:hypothetical protein